MFAVEGGAGCGKTFELMEALAVTTRDSPLASGQRVLALTFMVGAKHKLAERLRGMAGLSGRVECSTIDSFAWRLMRRWRGLLSALGVDAVAEEDYDGQCGAAATLLERPEVLSWVAASFPIVLVDEAQDLKPERLRMVAAMSRATKLLIAADEFQCLDPTLRPNPAVTWLHEVCRPRVLDIVHRTQVRGLLDAASAIRAGNPPRSQGAFKIVASRGDNMAPSFVSNAIGWGRPVGGTVAIITPSRAGAFAERVAARVGERTTRQGNGPYAVRWERSDKEDLEVILGGLAIEAAADLEQTLMALTALGPTALARAAIRWVQLQSRARGQTHFSRAELVAMISRELKMRRQRGLVAENRFAAMTVHQAKNREFEGVVVLWPYQLGGDAEHKRRLLYNAVTRARRWCTVVVQNESLLAAAPFA